MSSLRKVINSGLKYIKGLIMINPSLKTGVSQMPIPLGFSPSRVLVLIGIALLTVVSCEDFFEKDLDGKEVTIVSPKDSLKTQYTAQNFWWEKTDGALTYNLQIVSPSFDKMEKLLVDTNVTSTKFVYSLYPGKFQWRVRPCNGSSNGKYVVRSLEIDTTLDLRGQQVVLKTPLNDYATRGNVIRFSWNMLYNADDYRFEIKLNDWAGSRYKNPVWTQHDTITITSFDEGIYYWGVQAQNTGSATLYSTSKFFVDRTNPKTPVLTEPKDSTTLDAWPTTLKWTSAPDNGSAIHDSIVVATDKSFKSGSIKLSQKVDGQSQTVNLNSTGKFFWKVLSVDAAGNISSSSEIYLLTVSASNQTSQ